MEGAKCRVGIASEAGKDWLCKTEGIRCYSIRYDESDDSANLGAVDVGEVWLWCSVGPGVNVDGGEDLPLGDEDG